MDLKKSETPSSGKPKPTKDEAKVLAGWENSRREQLKKVAAKVAMTPEVVRKLGGTICSVCQKVVKVDAAGLPSPHRCDSMPTVELDREPDKVSAGLEIGELEDALDTIECIDAKYVHSETETADRQAIIFLLGRIRASAEAKARQILEGWFDEDA